METDCDAGATKAKVSVEGNPVSPKRDSEVLNLCDGKIVFSEWASNVSSILWVPVRALSEKLARGSSSGLQQKNIFLIITYLLSHPLANDHISFALTVNPLKQDILEGMRTVALKLEFGVHHNQIFERYCISSLSWQILIIFVPRQRFGRQNSSFPHQISL